MSAVHINIAIVIMMVSSALTLPSGTQKPITKRELPLYADIFPSFAAALNPLAKYASSYSWDNIVKSQGAPSPAEVANAIAVAKQASANVVIAQQQVQAAKDHVLNQQKVAMDKETTAALLTQKSEAAAAIQRSEAAAAAQAVVLAQQRLAASKAAVGHQQRIAAAKETEAASALQRAAHAAAAEIQRTENEAAKFANLQRTGSAAAAHHVAATKDATLAPLTSGNNHIPNLAIAWPAPAGPMLQSSNPWNAAAFFTPPNPAFAMAPYWK